MLQIILSKHKQALNNLYKNQDWMTKQNRKTKRLISDLSNMP